MDPANGPLLPANSHGPVFNVSAYDPASGSALMVWGGSLWRYTYATNAYALLSTDAAVPFAATGVIDPKRKLFIFFGTGYQTTAPYVKAISLAAGSNYALQDWSAQVSGCGALAGANYPGLAYDPVLDRIVGWPNAGGTVYIFNPDTKACTAQSFPNGPTNSARANGAGTFGRFAYFPSLNAYAVVSDWDQDAYLLRLSDSSPGTLPVGMLTHDGPATPEQLSLFLPVTGTLPQTASASVRYKRTNASTWSTGHPLYRIRPTLAEVPSAGTVPDAFAWPIIDLTPGTSYDVEVTLQSGTTIDVRAATFVTRSLPPAAGAPNKTIAAGSSDAHIQTVLSALNPGDVLQFENGTYNISSLQLTRGGTLNSPIVIRGASRTGVVLSAPTGIIFQIQEASHLILENMTLQGSGVDSGTASSSIGISFYNGTPNQTRVTVRNITMRGVDKGIRAWANIAEFLAYDNTLSGNNIWTPALIDTNATWNDDGINIPGFGNCAFNNTLKGFGDMFAVAEGYGTEAVGVHFYRNDVLMTGDDLVEVDGGHRNMTFYDNRARNSATFVSLDPLYGGPFLAARNISLNALRTPFKWNSTNAGQFIYNNTIIRTTGKSWLDGAPTAEAGWMQHNNGAQNAYGYRNNILIYQGAGNQTLRLDNGGHAIVDFTHNSWYPNAVFQWSPGRYPDLAGAQAGLPATTPVFSGSVKRHDQDNITTASPWTTAITLGSDYRTEVTTPYTPTLAAGSAPKNSGVVIANITDGYSGAAPDRGAIIAGRPVPTYGDRSSASVPNDHLAPAAPRGLRLP
jgi:hypothetical protein